MKIESVVIVGAGSSGWMTAALLSKVCPHLEIAIVEDPDSKPIGVGESTLGHFNLFLKLLDLCLLYTSPSPRVRQKSRMPSSA